jgi:4-hydroxybenzoate polyprenyltransferase
MEKQGEATTAAWDEVEVLPSDPLVSAPNLIPKSTDSKHPSALQTVGYFLKTLYLFSKSDLPTYVVPCTVFGVLSTLAGPPLTTESIPLKTLLLRVPAVTLWAWLFCVMFNISNQSSPEGVLEDEINKPHRPIPAGRITASHARLCMKIGVPAVLLLNYYILGAWEEMAVMYAVMYLYNDLKLGDNFFWKNFLIATAGNGVYNAGSLRIVSGIARESYFQCGGLIMTPTAIKWIALISSAVIITMHSQDLRDLEGDRARDRRTLPIVFGEAFARWTVAVPVMLFSIAAAWCWEAGIIGYAGICLPGAVVAYRVILLRDNKSDRRTYTLWAVWMMALYVQPLLRNLP